MSEYQYYEFQTIDRPLTREEQADISQLSSRVQLSSTRAIFTYQYGDFRGDARKVLAQYFDAMPYLANWGTKKLMFRFPKSLIDLQQVQPYCVEDIISFSTTGQHVILNIRFDDEGSEQLPAPVIAGLAHYQFGWHISSTAWRLSSAVWPMRCALKPPSLS